jgi:uncharacterized protein (DUF2062 family)
MSVLTYSVLGVAVAAIFCVYRRYVFDLFRARKRQRERVAYMLWTAAQKDRTAQPHG